MVGNVVRFRLRHARTSADSGSPIAARASKVTPGTPFSEASRAKATQRPDGIPPDRLRLSLSRQQLTLEGSRPSASATALVPPSASMTESGVVMSMARNIVCATQTCQGFATDKTTSFENCDAIGTMMDAPEIVAGRLRALQKELGFKTQTAFAEALGIDKSTYSLYVNGHRPLTFETALLIRKQWGISLDWMFFGDLGMAPQSLMLKVGRYPGAEPEPARKVRKAS